jgi:hypothetical protein
MRYTDIIEAHHAYDTTQQPQYMPLKGGDTVRVFHGYREFTDALEAARHGVSGQVRAARVYSYESDNNPKGLFVTLSMKVAAEFTGAYGPQVIMEFNAKMEDLEAPVWPGGSYTVQGQMSQYFGHGAQGRANRREAAKNAEAETNSQEPHVMASDKKYLADLLMNSREHQALFIGNLNPESIVAWHVRPDYRGEFERITPEEFNTRYADKPLHKDSRAGEKMFKPDEAFDPKLFVERMKARYGGSRDDEFFMQFFRNAWERIKASSNKMHAVHEYYDMYLWPRQILPMVKWMRATFK